MSFSTDIKNELIANYPKSACCRKSIAAGLEMCSQKNGKERELNIVCESEGIKDFVVKLIREKYKTDVSYSCIAKRGRTTHRFNFNIDSSKYDYSDPNELFKCPNCASAFIKGVFIYEIL